MAFVRPWDDTFPPDTQLANLLGQDIREFKEDVAERITQFSTGLLADRPTPEAVFGIANVGVQYFAHDVGVLYKWDGLSWIAVKYNGTFSEPTVATVVAPVIETAANTVIVPVGAIATGCQIDIITAAEALDPAATITLRLYIQSLIPIISLSWVGTGGHGIIQASFILSSDSKITGIFYSGVAAVGNIQTMPAQAFDPTSAAAIGSTVQATVGDVQKRGLIVRISL